MPDDVQSKLTVLVVEDEWFVRMAIVEFLEARNLNVIEARNGEAAAEVLHGEDSVDAVFTDIKLGGKINGWDVGELAVESKNIVQP